MQITVVQSGLYALCNGYSYYYLYMRFPYEQYFLDALLAMCPKPLTRALLGVMRQRDDQTRLGLAHHPEKIPS